MHFMDMEKAQNVEDSCLIFLYDTICKEGVLLTVL